MTLNLKKEVYILYKLNIVAQKISNEACGFGKIPRSNIVIAFNTLLDII